MTAKELLADLDGFFAALADRIVDGEITELEAEQSLAEVLLQAREEMTDEELLEIQRGMLELDHAISRKLAERGRPVPGNNPHRPN